MARQLDQLRDRLEGHYKEVQDFEFTIERGVLYSLQTRNGKMNAVAMVRTSVEMVRAGLINKEQALLRIDPMHLEQMLYPRFESRNSRVRRWPRACPHHPARRPVWRCSTPTVPSCRAGPGAAGDSGA